MSQNFGIKNFLIYFVSLLPFAIITGPFFPDLIVSCSSIFFLYYIFNKKKFEVFDNIFFKLFLLAWIYLVINSLFAKETLFSLKTSIFYIRFGVFSLVIYFLCNEIKFLDLFTKVLVFVIILVLADATFQFYTGKNFFGYPISQDNRLSSFFKDELIVGSYLARSFPLLISLVFLNLSNHYSKIWFLLLNLFFIAVPTVVFLSGERASFFFTLFYIFIIIFFLRKKLKIIYISIIFLFSLLLILNFSYVSLSDRMVNQFLSETGIGKSSIQEKNISEASSSRIYIFSKIHEGHILTAFNIFKENIIFGAGPNMFRYSCSDPKYAVTKYNCTTHPHNFHIQILAETGIVGYLFLLSSIIYLLILLIKLFLRSKNISYRSLSLVSLVIGLIVTLQPITSSGNFFNNWLSILVYLPVGFLIYLRKSDGL
jgi:O-antigen ligase